ncbi:TMEM175 family protein [Streptomyces sp. GSL17-111]|uniref:TMEM175 family protein n=1 Tax=Streptomyces sp. GSL17-111 TaxID=3121596 RepID=UPI0030F46473
MERPPEAREQDRAADERLVALSDGVFAIALTILVLDLSVPPDLGPQAFHAALREALPGIGAYALSFWVIAQLWWDHRRILAAIPEIDVRVVWLTLLGLALVALVPFPTAVLADYSEESSAVALYAAVVAAVNAVHLALRVLSHRGPGQAASPEALRLQRLDDADVAVAVVLFGLAVPLAFVSPTAALLSWLLFLPLKPMIGLRQKAAARRARRR